jgi:hypothetical protein
VLGAPQPLKEATALLLVESPHAAPRNLELASPMLSPSALLTYNRVEPE